MGAKVLRLLGGRHSAKLTGASTGRAGAASIRVDKKSIKEETISTNSQQSKVSSR